MRILVTSDDGILSEGLWTLVKELRTIAQVIVVAPDREQSAIGTAVTLRQVLRVNKVRPLVPEVETYTVDGTPSDSVILALGNLIKHKVDLVIAGINQGLNLGEDVHISGTVGGALQGYLRGFPAMGISSPYGNQEGLETAAKVAALLAKRIIGDSRLSNVLLNVNAPELPLPQIKGVMLTRLASESHINTVEEGNRSRQKYYWLIRQRASKVVERGTDIWAVDGGNVSVTPLWPNRYNKSLLPVLSNLCNELSEELRK